MKRQSLRVNVSPLAVLRIDSVVVSQRTVRGALSSVRGWCERIRREIGRKDKRIEQQNRSNEIRGNVLAKGMHLDEEELRNFNNENLENELKELVRKLSF